MIGRVLEEIKSSNTTNLPELADTVPDIKWVKKLLERFTLGEMRARFVAQILDGERPADLPEHMSGKITPSSSGSTELFWG